MREYCLDLQLHGKFAGGVSKSMELPVLSQQAKLKGLDVLSTGDILHKRWFSHVRENVVEESNGVYADKNGNCYFIVGGELEDKDGIHHLFYLPSLESALELRQRLLPFGNLDCALCGRPFVKLSPEKIAENVCDVGGVFGPAHSFTPYTGIYAFYDSLKSAYGSMSDKLYFIELGLSADTFLADLISENHAYSFLTSSDAHSPWPNRLGREFVKIKMHKPDFNNLKRAFCEREDKLITLNVGLDPKEGKYHCTACSNCFLKYSLADAVALNWKCSKCGHDIKRGVRDRIMLLKNTAEGVHPNFRPDYLHILPLLEIIQSALSVKGVNTKAVNSKWFELVELFGNEIKILTEVNESELIAEGIVGEFIVAFRKGFVIYLPGGGGKYGKPIVCRSEEEFNKVSAELKFESHCPDNAPQKKILSFLK
ncbi:MAG: endonuclease Q family protein [Candidatus Diapherotrites archaeon]